MTRAPAVLLLLLPAACGGPEPPWREPPDAPVALRVAVEPKEVPLLQPVTVTLDLWHEPDVKVRFTPEVAGDDFVTRSTTTDDERPFGGGLWRRTTLVLLPAKGPGELTLPAFVAEVDGQDVTAETTEQVLAITSALPVGADPAIEAPGEPFPTPFGGWWWLAGGAVLLALVATGFVWWRRRPRPVQADTVALPPHTKALRELSRWHGAPRTTRAEIEAFYVGVSHVLRVYLEERFALHAPERTTEEFLRDLEGGDRLAQRHRAELERFLSQCDLVKFAAVTPSAGEHDMTWSLAEGFVQSTRPDRAAGAPAGERAREPEEALP